MRLGAGDAIAAVQRARRRMARRRWPRRASAAACCLRRDRPRPLRLPPDLWLLFAPIKKARTDFIVEKAVEMGAARILPVQTDFTNAERIRQDRLQAHAVEAAEQCGGTFVPEVAELCKARPPCWPTGPRAASLMFCDEALVGRRAPSGGRAEAGPWAILIGPEGGFSRRRTRAACRAAVRHHGQPRPPHPARRYGRCRGADALAATAGRLDDDLQPTVRLHLFFARDTPRAVILRQGPSTGVPDDPLAPQCRHFRRRSVAEAKGLCRTLRDLSPDGRHFLYFTLDGRWRSPAEGPIRRSATRPTSRRCALFPEGNTWGGGGQFLDRHHVRSKAGRRDIIGRDEGIGQVFQGEPGKGCTTGLRYADGTRMTMSRETRARLLDGDAWQPPSHRVSHQDGVLFRRRGQEIWPIRDFNDMTFEPINAPYDVVGLRPRSMTGTPWMANDRVAVPRADAAWPPDP